MRAVAEFKPPVIGKKVVVVGGSNTAMDAARTAVRLGAQVVVVYRRTVEEMPAEKSEIREAIIEGVKFHFLAAPLEVIQTNGRVSGINLQKMKLGEPDASGRRSPVPEAGAEEFLEADTIISAIGQDSFKTPDDIFLIGDATGKTAYAIEAIGQGRAIVPEVHKHMMGEAAVLHWEEMPPVLVKGTKTAEDFADAPKVLRQNEDSAAPVQLVGDFYEIHKTLTPVQAAKEAERCLACGCADYFECKLIKLSNEYGASAEKFCGEFFEKPNKPIDTSNFNFHRDMNKCVMCGLCVQACENDVLTAVGRSFETTVEAAFNSPLQNRDECKLCGNCVTVCPVGALYEVQPLKKPLITKEEITETTCTFCEKGCGKKIATKAGIILRCLPMDKNFCEVGRFGFKNLGERLIFPLVRKEGLLRRASVAEAIKAVREGLNVLMASYGVQSIAVAVSPRYVNKDIAAVKKYAERLATPNFFMLSDFDSCAEKIREGQIKGLVYFGDDLPPTVAELPLEFLVLQTAYVNTTTKKSAARANIVLPAPAFAEVFGSIQTEKGILPVNSVFDPTCGYQTRELISQLL